MEAGESGCEEKARKLVASFGHRFVQIFVTIHPSNIPGESRGKSSNVAWATSFYNQHLCQPDDARFEIITVIDGTIPSPVLNFPYSIIPRTPSHSL